MKRIFAIIFCMVTLSNLLGHRMDKELILLKSYPQDGEVSQTCNGNVSFIFNQDISFSDVRSIQLDGKPTHSSIDKNTLTIPYHSMEQGKRHTILIKKHAIKGENNQTLKKDIILRFNTIKQPTVRTKQIPDFIVDGSEGKTFIDAIRSANQSQKDGRYIIFVKKNKNGYDVGFNDFQMPQKPNSRKPEYGAVLKKENVSIIGEDNGGAMIYHKSLYEGISITAVLVLDTEAHHFYMQDMTIKNTMPFVGDPSRAVAVQEKSSHNIYKNVRLISGQDTYFTQNTQTYHEDCEIHGTIDFICGSGDVFFKNTLLYVGDYPRNLVTAQDGQHCKYGYVFDHCTIAGQQGYFLGRPWKNHCKTVFLNTNLIAQPYLQGWDDPINPSPDHYLGEYNNQTAQSVFHSKRGIQLSCSQAAEYNIETVLGHADNWRPSVLTLQSAPPSDQEITLSKNLLKWKDNPTVLYWAIVKDGTIIDFTTETSYTLPEAGKYSIRASNAMGGLGRSSKIVDFVSY